MADIQKWDDTDIEMEIKKEKPNNSTYVDPANVRKSTRLKQHAKFEKHMSMFVMQSKKGERRGRSPTFSTSEEEDEIPAKVAKKSEPKPKVNKSPAKPKPSPKKVEIKEEPMSSSTEEEDDDDEFGEDDPNDKDFSLSMLDLRRVGDQTPLNDKKQVTLNARGMPTRIRKKNKLFFDDNVMYLPTTKNKKDKKPPSEKKIIQKPKMKPEKSSSEQAKASVVDDNTSMEIKSVRTKIGIKLRNFLKLPKAQRFVYCEWFYSDIDRVLFFGKNDFLQCCEDTNFFFKSKKHPRGVWSGIRKIVGKPRRCSQNFLREERETLQYRRNQIRNLQQRKIKDVTQCKDLPDRIPLQLSVNSRVTAKLRYPQSGLFTGKVDAVDPSNNTYRITFDRVGLGTHSIPDYEVLLNGEPDYVSLSTMHRRYMSSRMNAAKRAMGKEEMKVAETSWMDNIASAKFPKMFYEMMVRICKILKEKTEKVHLQAYMNSKAEKMMSLGEEYPEEFQRRYASTIIQLESINISLNRYLSAVQKYCHQYAPDICASAMLAPSFIHNKCLTEAKILMATYFKDKEPLENKKLIDFVLELMGMVYQLHNLTKGRTSIQERQVLKQSIVRLKTLISPKNHLLFQQSVEVHVQYLEAAVHQSSHLSPLIVTSHK